MELASHENDKLLLHDVKGSHVYWDLFGDSHKKFMKM